MHDFSDEAIGRLRRLVEIVSPSMQEDAMTEWLRAEWAVRSAGARVRTDAMGNLEVAFVRDASYPTFAIVAHADTICIQLTHCVGKGRYRFRSIGASPHMLLGQPLVILTEDGRTFNAVVGFDATSQFGQPKGLVFEDMWVDVPDAEGADAVSPGDLAVLSPRIEIAGGYVCGTALDDRIGLFVIGEVIRAYTGRGAQWPVNLVCVASVQEEVGLRGGAMFDFSLAPDGIIVVDTDYATDIPTPHEDQMGRLHLGAGPGVQRKADNTPSMRRSLKVIAGECGLPLQTSLGRFVYGGTDAAPLQVSRRGFGYPVCNLSIPCRYMHSPVETVALADVSAAVELISAWLEKAPSL